MSQVHQQAWYWLCRAGNMSQLALRRWPNIGPTSTLTLGQRRLTNVGPTWICQLAQRWRANVVPTLAQHYANGCMPTLYQHWPNGGCVTGFLWGEPIGHRCIPLTKGQERWRWCLPKHHQLNKQSSWVTGDLRHQCDRRECNIHMSKDMTVLFLRCTDWSKHNVQKDNGLSLPGAKSLSEPTLVYIVNWTLANKLPWKFNRNSFICIQENAFENVIWKNGVNSVWVSLN